MCGILCNISKQYDLEDIKKMLKDLDYRGPDNSKILEINSNIVFGFTRLAINDVSENGDQPMILDDSYYLICNGEIYNYKALVEENKFKLKSNSDCEVILHMYKKYGINETVKSLDGVFGFILYDNILNNLFIARDPYGVRPLFIGHNKIGDVFIASTIKPISDYCV
jgi:asparagine synthase (glutamine-hydrolysing)